MTIPSGGYSDGGEIYTEEEMLFMDSNAEKHKQVKAFEKARFQGNIDFLRGGLITVESCIEDDDFDVAVKYLDSYITVLQELKERLLPLT